MTGLSFHFWDWGISKLKTFKLHFFVGWMLLLCFSANSLFAQEQKYITTIYNVSDGLSHNNVSALTTDKHGFMWLATQAGINKFDSYNFQSIKPEENEITGINSSQLESIFADSKGNIWAGLLVGGVICYNTETETFKHFYPSEKDTTSLLKGGVKSIIEDKEGKIWIGTESGLCVFDPNTSGFKRYVLKMWNWQLSINDMLCDKEGNIWLATLPALWKLNRDKDVFERIDIPKPHAGFGSEAFISLAEDTLRNCLWIGGWRRNLVKYFPETGEFQRKLTKQWNSYDLHVDSRGTVWVACWGAGIYRVHPQTMEAEQHTFEGDSVLIKEMSVIRKITEDVNGDVWFGTWTSGVVQISRTETFKRWPLPTLHGELKVRGIATKDSTVFIGTPHGVFMTVRGNRFSKLKQIDVQQDITYYSPTENAVRNIFKDREGRIWVSRNDTLSEIVKHKGEYVLKGTDIFFPVRNNLILRKLSSIVFKDSVAFTGNYVKEAAVFDLTKEGKYKLRKAFEPKYGERGFLTHPLTNAVFMDSQEQVWYGTIGGLYYVENDTSFISVNERIVGSAKLTSDLINHITEDKKGRLLISTANGFNVLSPNKEGMYKLQKYTTENGLPQEYVVSSLVDKQNMIWIRTQEYLLKLDIEKNMLNAYGKRDGVDVTMFTPGADQNEKGDIFMGAAGKVIKFNPNEIKYSLYKPNLVVGVMRIGNKIVKAGRRYNDRVILSKSIIDTEAIEITHKEKEFSLELSLLHFQKAKQSHYEYKLEGFDEDWNSSGINRIASYTNLPAREYVFRARTLGVNGEYINLEHPLTIKVIPPWWETVWFRLLVVFVIVSLAVSYYLYRMRAIKLKNQELERMVMQRTQELSSANKLLMEHQEEVMMQNEEIKQQNEEIAAQRDHVQKQKLEIEASLQNTRLLSEFGQKLTSTFDLDFIYSMVQSYVASIVQAGAFGVGIYRPLKNLIEYPAFFEGDEQLPFFAKKHQPHNSFPSWAIANEKEVFENDIEANYQNYFQKRPSVLSKLKVRSIMVIPLYDNQKVIGVFAVYCQKANAYSKKDFSFVRSLSAYLSIAIANGRLYREVNRKNEHIQSSINYARNIQNSILPPQELMNRFLNTFILFRPKDVVSGDFYWHIDLKDGDKNEAIFAVVDCTGHGVPGAFMSMIGNRILNRITLERKVTNTAQILTELDEFIKSALRQEETQNNDGMDVCLCKISQVGKKYQVEYAGAKRNLLVVRPNGEFSQLNGTRRSIGGARRKKNVDFERSTQDLEKGTMLYLSSDGYIDQNSEDNAKFGSQALHNLLSSIYLLDLDLQQQRLEIALDEFQRNAPQRDDISILGIRLEGTQAGGNNQPASDKK